MAYSERFSRCMAAWPGLGFAAAARSSDVFEVRSQRVSGRSIRPRHSLRRHGAGAQFANDFFPGFRGGGNVVQVGVLQRKAAGAQFRAMAGDAVFVNDCLLGGGRILLSRERQRAPPRVPTRAAHNSRSRDAVTFPQRINCIAGLHATRGSVLMFPIIVSETAGLRRFHTREFAATTAI